MNTFDNKPTNNDPDDILDIAVMPRSLSHSQPEVGQPKVGQQQAPSPAASRLTNEDSAHLSGDWATTPARLGSDVIVDSDLPTLDEAGPLESEPHPFGLIVREVVETVGLAVIIFLIIRVGIQNYRIEGASMEPNFHHGEYLIVNKLAYRLGEYTRGDVIVFKYPNDPSKDYIKRVIGLPGDTVEIRNGQLYVNEKQIDEPYPHMPNVRDEPSSVVDAGHLYVLGDNRPASSDTRNWGQLGQEFVIGQAWLAIWPFDQAGLVEHHPIEVSAVMAQGP